MHEWLITRGDVDYAHFEWQMQIYVPCNAVICHAGRCHARLQKGEEGREKCLEYILRYHSKNDIQYWLSAIKGEVRIANEKERWLWK